MKTFERGNGKKKKSHRISFLLTTVLTTIEHMNSLKFGVDSECGRGKGELVDLHSDYCCRPFISLFFLSLPFFLLPIHLEGSLEVTLWANGRGGCFDFFLLSHCSSLSSNCPVVCNIFCRLSPSLPFVRTDNRFGPLFRALTIFSKTVHTERIDWITGCWRSERVTVCVSVCKWMEANRSPTCWVVCQ